MVKIFLHKYSCTVVAKVQVIQQTAKRFCEAIIEKNLRFHVKSVLKSVPYNRCYRNILFISLFYFLTL
jgi:hypothetical protein